MPDLLQQPPPPGTEQMSPTEDREEQDELNAVKRWTKIIKEDKAKWDKDFKRMRENMDFVSGLQWPSQKSIKYEKYVANLTLREIAQKVASLYARNPKAEAQRRHRLDFQMWDGQMESIMQAVMAANIATQQGGPMAPEAAALIGDFQQGRMKQQLVERVARTWEIVYQYQIDTQNPDFKILAKQWVRRVSICGVGFVRARFVREDEAGEYVIATSEAKSTTLDRMRRMKLILEKLEDSSIDQDSAEVNELKALAASIGVTSMGSDLEHVSERLSFDFPPSTSIIPDKRTRNLKGFVGAHHITQEYMLPVDYVNALFETDIKPGGDVKEYNKGQEQEIKYEAEAKDTAQKPLVALWETFDLDTRSTFFLVDGYKKFVCAPEPTTPEVKGFWNHVALTFNDVEVEDGCEASIYPPSDVDLIRSAQLEWNRSREALRVHRKANAPKYFYPKGTLTEADLNNLENADEQQIVGLEGLNPGTEPRNVVQPLQTEDIKIPLYDVAPLQLDIQLASGSQQANLGPAQPNVTATVGTIAEQSRITVSSSNVDDLDDALTTLANIGGEMLLREMNPETVKRIAGPGAVWPTMGREDFLNEIELKIVAASSGRPNKAIDIANFERLAPMLLQAGANPQAIIREAIRRLDDQLDPSDFFPVPVPAVPPGNEQAQPTGVKPAAKPQQAGAPQRPQPLQELQSGSPVPLAAA